MKTLIVYGDKDEVAYFVPNAVDICHYCKKLNVSIVPFHWPVGMPEPKHLHSTRWSGYCFSCVIKHETNQDRINQIQQFAKDHLDLILEE